jgi:amino acid adenylation domain-containing protein
VSTRPVSEQPGGLARTASSATLDAALRGTLIGGFIASTRRNPDRPALVVDGETLSYAELRAQVEAIAGLLAERTAPDRPALCGVYAYRSKTAYAGLLGALYAGRGYVPLNRTFPVARTRFMLEQAGCSALIVDKEALGELDKVLDGQNRRLLIIAPDQDDLRALRARHPSHEFAGRAELAAQSGCEPVAVDPGAIAYVLFTSGSTGTPKGVGVTHQNVRTFVDYNAALYAIGPDDRLGQLFDLTFDVSVFDMFIPWECGGAVCVPPDLNRPDRFIREAGLTVWYSIPSLAIVMQRLGMLKPDSFPALRLSLFAGEALPDDVAAAWARAAPASEVENLYGPTELTITCTRYRWSASRRDEAHLGIVPIGWPYPHMDVLLVDDELREVADGEEGELICTGPQMTEGYWKDPVRTDERYVVPPGRTARYYRTGDRAMRRTAGGPLLYLGRLDDQIKVRGQRVELGEIEAVIREEAGVQGVVALGWPRTVAGITAVEAFVEAEITDAEVRAVIERMNRRLPAFMVPRRIHAMERLPLNANGKYDRRALMKVLEDSRQSVAPNSNA